MYHPDEKTDVFYEGYGHQQGYYDVNHSLSGGDSYPEDQPGYSSPSPQYSNQAFRQRAPTGPSPASRAASSQRYATSSQSWTPSSSWQTHSQNLRYQSVQPQHTPQWPSSSGRSQNSYPSATDQGIKLVPVSSLPDMYRSIFKFGVFNAIQSQCFETVVNTNQNMVISAPTGSGKTVLFELAIIRILLSGASQAKCVYMSPTKALCSERFNDWTKKFQPLGIKCCELTGDTVDTSRKAWNDAKDAGIIVTTPEKWDSLTRNWRGHQDLLGRMKIFLVDEVHILNETRGSTLEVCISRMKIRGTAVRFILLSATAPNIEDIASWIGENSDGYGTQQQTRSAMVFKFGEEFRPCRITRHVYSYPPKNQNSFQFSKMLDFRLFDLLQRHACGKPVLIFCPTRKGVAATAEQLAKEYKKCVEEKRKAPWTHPERAEGRFQDAQLNVLLASGLGVHHAGLSMDDRKMTEEFYLTGQIRALVATSTLAVGVNLPAHTVVIKGTQMWSGAAWTEYCDLDVMQMLGRAGRPQFDKEGLAIIMCSSDKEQHYRALTSGTTTIESSLHMNLTEHLNSEVGLGTITSLETAKSWLHNSFLFQRLKRNPSHYALGKDASQTWEQRLNDLVAESVQSLCELDLVTTTRDDVGHIRMLAATDFGEIMSRYYIRYPTMRLILQLPEKVTMRELLEMITQADEFTDVRLRGSDRQVYNALRDNSDIRMTVKKIEKPCDKIFVLLQAVLGGVSLNVKEYKTAESQPALEALGVLRHAVRIARAMVDIAGVKRNAFQLKFGLELLRSFSAKAWDDRPIVLRQIPQIGEKSLKVLASVGIRGLGELRTQDSHRLEVLLNRKPPFGHDILEEVSALPKYRLKINEAALTHSGGTEPVVASLAIEVGLDGPLTTPRGKKAPILGFASVLTVTSDMEFIDYRRIPVRNLTEPKSFTVVARLEKPSQAIEVMVSSESYAGLSVLQHYKPVLSPKSYPTMKTRPKTELAELEGLQGVDPSIWTITEEEVLDLTTGTQDDIVAPVPTQSSVPEATQLPNGRFACSHTCKDKQTCRHFCCREGLAKAPKSLKGPAEPKATQPPPQNFAATSGLSTNKPNVGPTPTKKPKSQSSIADKTMEKLNKLQESSNVGLKMPSGGRLSLSNENKGNSTRPPWLAEAEFSPKYASLYSPKRNEEDEDLPDIAGKALRTTKRGKDEAPSTDYSDDAFNELLANADWEALSRPPKRTTNSIRKRSPDEEEDVLLVEEDDMPPAKKLRTHKGSIPVASSSRTPFGDRNGSTLLSANKTSATSSKPGTENKRPLFLPASSPSPPSTYHHAPAPLQQNDVETVDVDPLPLDARPNKSHTLGLGDFGFDEELFEMEEDPLAGEVDDNVRGGPLAPGTSMVSADTHGTGGTFRGLGQVASSSSAALSSSAHAFGSGALGRPGLALANRPSLSLGAANSGSSSTSRVKDPLQSEAEVRSEPAAPAHGADDGGARQDSDVTRSGVDAPVARGCLYDAVGAFLDWMENSGDVEFVD